MSEEKIRVLVIEDEDPIRKGLNDTLVFNGYEVLSAERGDSGLELALKENIDLLILDIMLPGKNGFEICNEVRTKRPDLPIIMLSAKSAEEDVLEGLQLGADDYVTKPFSLQELMLRVKAVLRRAKPEKTTIQFLRIGDAISIDCTNGAGKTSSDETVLFTRREIALLKYLHAHSHQAVSRQELLAEVWSYAPDAQIETRTVDIHIAKLRKKIEGDHKNPAFLITVRGQGYRLLESETSSPT